jgi:N-acyl-D-amino-acid deacylase
VRTLFCGFGRARPDDYQMRLIKAAIAESMEQGAVGLSTGLDYIAQCFAGTDELVEACSAMQPLDGLYVSHVRYKKGVLAGVQEALEIGRRAGVRVHISHLKGTTPEDVDAVLGWLDELDRQGADLSFDVYPYLPGSTMLNYLLPYEVWEDGPLAVLGKLGRRDVREKFARSLQFNSLEHAWFAWVAGKENARLQGTRVADYVAEQNRPAADVLCDLLIEERLAVLMVFRYPCDDTLVEPFLAHPRHMLGTDGIYHPEGVVHPRMYGSVGRFLGPLVREKRLVSLEDAVWKLSGFPAERFRLPRGKLAKGAVADVVVFDPATIAERATYADPHRETVGIEHVLVAGTPIIREGQVVEDLAPSLPGRLLPARTELRAMA